MRLGSLSSDVFQWRRSTEREPFFLLIGLDATKFGFLIVLNSESLFKKLTAEECKTSTSGWRVSLKNVVA